MYIEGKVSIIVPVYNAENFLNRTVDSILAQTYENWELLLADDCSTDQSRDIMSSYTDERIHCFYCEKIQDRQAQETLRCITQRDNISLFWMQMISGCRKS